MRGIGGGGAMQSAYRRHTFTLSFAVLHYHHLVHPLFTVLSVIIDGDYSLCLPSLPKRRHWEWEYKGARWKVNMATDQHYCYYYLNCHSSVIELTLIMDDRSSVGHFVVVVYCWHLQLLADVHTYSAFGDDGWKWWKESRQWLLFFSFSSSVLFPHLIGHLDCERLAPVNAFKDSHAEDCHAAAGGGDDHTSLLKYISSQLMHLCSSCFTCLSPARW